jgi:hypothetical protein
MRDKFQKKVRFVKKYPGSSGANIYFSTKWDDGHPMNCPLRVKNGFGTQALLKEKKW